MLWLALHFADLPLEIFTAEVSQEAVRPLAILQNNRICRLNSAAEDCGITPGGTLATAHSIYPDLAHKQRDETLEQQRLSSLANTLYRFSSYVSIQPPDCILLEIGASLKLFGCHTELTQQAIALCKSLGHRSIGRVAQTPWASIALARSAQQRLADVPLSDTGLEMAGIHANTVERFANMGIYTLGPLLKLPDKALGRGFGKPLLRYLQQLTGALPDPRKAITPAPGFRRALHLLQPLRDKNDLYGHPAGPVPQLLRELEQWLISRQLGCELLSWRLHSHNREVAHLPIRFASLKQSAGDLLRISKLKLEQYELPAEVLSVSLQAQRLQAWCGTSQGLFGMHGGAGLNSQSAHAQSGDKHIMSELIDEFTARLGNGTCYGLCSTAQHTPERAWQALQAHELCRSAIGKSGTQTHSEHVFPPHADRRPLWLFDPPRQVRRADLDLLQGPERIHSQWWSSTAVCRDYYVARHRLGAQCWAFVDVQDRWYLHGYFG